MQKKAYPLNTIHIHTPNHILVHIAVHLAVNTLMGNIHVHHNDEDCSITQLALSLNLVYKERIQKIIFWFFISKFEIRPLNFDV